MHFARSRQKTQTLKRQAILQFGRLLFVSLLVVLVRCFVVLSCFGLSTFFVKRLRRLCAHESRTEQYQCEDPGYSPHTLLLSSGFFRNSFLLSEIGRTLCPEIDCRNARLYIGICAVPRTTLASPFALW